MRSIAAAIVLAIPMACWSADEWLNHPTPGISRTRTGAPYLSATVPRALDGRPDLSGVWASDGEPYNYDIGLDLSRAASHYSPGPRLPSKRERKTWARAVRTRAACRTESFRHHSRSSKAVIRSRYSMKSTWSIAKFFWTAGIFLKIQILRDPNPT